MAQAERPDSVIVLPPGGGRHYAMGRMQARFLADGEETVDRYSISEWWLEPHTEGPGAHRHDANDDVFYVIGGTMSFLAGEAWFEAGPGSFVRIPAGVTHDFANRGEQRAGVLNFYIPGGFEADMPAIVDWFAANPPR
ncbi:cupin domain-containing protein [Chitinolyticbacter meiyuanensis]|uniref:cupin domain-containing protein n=1 Tax=Chitinolyticbacter meiyuanensis TaxID=682798 RepID=UPI0011E5C1E0|nr:cupin domain-containing protein [Chitinolyticbacter meiyuanensis]